MEQEPKLAYVVRKLKNKVFNRSQVSRETGVQKTTLHVIANDENSNPSYATVETLYDFFQRLAE